MIHIYKNNKLMLSISNEFPLNFEIPIFLFCKKIFLSEEPIYDLKIHRTPEGFVLRQYKYGFQIFGNNIPMLENSKIIESDFELGVEDDIYKFIIRNNL